MYGLAPDTSYGSSRTFTRLRARIEGGEKRSDERQAQKDGADTVTPVRSHSLGAMLNRSRP
jgi:hypothetical protein